MSKSITAAQQRNLESTLYHVFVLTGHFNNAIDALQDTQFGQIENRNRNIIFSAAVFYADIKAVAFLDEWNDYLSPLLLTINEIELQRAIGTIIRNINQKWPEYKKIRNQVLAHNFREKGNRSIFDKQGYYGYKAPKTYPDRLEIGSWFREIFALLEGAYPEQFKLFHERKWSPQFTNKKLR